MHIHRRRMRRAFSVLRILPLESFSAVFDGSSDDGGGARGGGNGSGNPSGSEQPVGLTEEAQKQVNELINKALGPRFRDFEAKQTKTLENFGQGLTEKLLGGLDEKLSTLKQTEPKDPKTKDGSPDLSQHPDFRALKKQNEELAKAIKAEQEEKAAAKAKARTETLRNTVVAALVEAGIAKTAHAAGYLIDTAKIVGYEDDESENIVFRDEEGGPLPLKKGLSDWAKSDDGKLYAPARSVSGSGDQLASGGSRRGTLPSSGVDPAKPSRALIGETVLALSGMQRQ